MHQSSNMSTPQWFREVREFCQTATIEIMGWGLDTLVVKAESPQRTAEETS
jgi:hypothetical protein